MRFSSVFEPLTYLITLIHLPMSADADQRYELQSTAQVMGICGAASDECSRVNSSLLTVTSCEKLKQLQEFGAEKNFLSSTFVWIDCSYGGRGALYGKQCFTELTTISDTSFRCVKMNFLGEYAHVNCTTLQTNLICQVPMQSTISSADIKTILICVLSALLVVVLICVLVIVARRRYGASKLRKLLYMDTVGSLYSRTSAYLDSKRRSKLPSTPSQDYHGNIYEPSPIRSSIDGYTEINDDSVATECGYATTRSVRNVGYPGRTGEYPGRAESLDPYSECGEEYGYAEAPSDTEHAQRQMSSSQHNMMYGAEPDLLPREIPAEEYGEIYTTEYCLESPTPCVTSDTSNPDGCFTYPPTDHATKNVDVYAVVSKPPKSCGAPTEDVDGVHHASDIVMQDNEIY